MKSATLQRWLGLGIMALLGLPAILLPTACLEFLGAMVGGDPFAMTIAVGGGLAIGIHVVARSTEWFCFTIRFLHEASHLQAVVLMAGVPRSFSCTRRHGHIEYDLKGPLIGARSFIIALAPYWFSPLVLAAALWMIFAPPAHPVEVSALGMVAGFALTTTLEQLDPRQHDLAKNGVLLPFLSATWMWAAVVVLTLRCGSAGHLGIWSTYAEALGLI